MIVCCVGTVPERGRGGGPGGLGMGPARPQEPVVRGAETDLPGRRARV
jgi:hypothetical protein